LVVFNNSSKFKDYLNSMNYDNSVLLMMSSGNFGNINFSELQELLLK